MKSSVELFAISLYEKGFLQGNGDEINELLEHHKAMHKEEMIQFATDYLDSKCYASFNGNVECACSVEEFYKETYGGNQ